MHGIFTTILDDMDISENRDESILVSVMVEVEYDANAEEKPTRDYPGCPASIEITSVTFNRLMSIHNADGKIMLEVAQLHGILGKCVDAVAFHDREAELQEKAAQHASDLVADHR
jgi:hypothetical protein